MLVKVYTQLEAARRKLNLILPQTQESRLNRQREGEDVKYINIINIYLYLYIYIDLYIYIYIYIEIYIYIYI